MKKRADTQQPRKPGESDEDYNKRMSKFYKQLANDLKKFDQKCKLGNKHAQKIQNITNRANNFQKAYENKMRDRLVRERFQNRKKEIQKCAKKYEERTLGNNGCPSPWLLFIG